MNHHPNHPSMERMAAKGVTAFAFSGLPAMIDRVAAAGTATEVAAKLKEFYDAGARHFVFLPATGGADPRPVLDRLFEMSCRRSANTRPARRPEAAAFLFTPSLPADNLSASWKWSLGSMCRCRAGISLRCTSVGRVCSQYSIAGTGWWPACTW